MSKNREESIKHYEDWGNSWYGVDCRIYDEYNYMVISCCILELFQILSCREDGWLFCGFDGGSSYVFTWEGD